eukprot:12041474-Alexandrium_andersonii.AAC.1
MSSGTLLAWARAWACVVKGTESALFVMACSRFSIDGSERSAGRIACSDVSVPTRVSQNLRP